MADASRGAEGVRADNGDAAPAIAAVLDAAADTSFAPVGDREDHVPTGGSLRVLLVVVAGLSLVLVAGAATVSWRRRLTIRHQPAHGDVDLAGLLRGAVARPRAYGDVRAVYTRKVVPILGDRSINLRRASALASRDRLTVTFAGGELARRAADSGVPVIDGRRREGRAVASVLGAVDLDRWDRLLAAGVGHPVGRRLERAAMAVGETWRVTLSRGAPDDVAVLDGPLAGLGRRHRVVVIDGDGDRSTSILDLAEQRPAVAALLFAELVVEAIDGSRSWKRRVLRELAKDAVAEQADRAR